MHSIFPKVTPQIHGSSRDRTHVLRSPGPCSFPSASTDKRVHASLWRGVLVCVHMSACVHLAVGMHSCVPGSVHAHVFSCARVCLDICMDMFSTCA